MSSRHLLTLVLVAAGALGQAPPNDNCSGAIAITTFPSLTPGTNVNATFQTITGQNCGTSANNKDVWYSFIPAVGCIVTVGTCPPGSTTFDCVIGVFTGTCSSLVAVPGTCQTTSCAPGTSVSFAGTAGVRYLIKLRGTTNASGTFVLFLDCAAPPANDECAAATQVFDGINAGTNAGATTSPGFAGSCSPGGSDVFYRYVATANGPLDISLCMTPGGMSDLTDSVLTVRDGSCAGPEIACNDDSCGLLSAVQITATLGHTYFIRVAGYSASYTGTFALEIAPPAPPPANDLCIHATTIGDGTYLGDNTTATTEPGMPAGNCGVNPTNDVWFLYPNSSGCTWNVTASLCNGTTGTIDTVLRVFTGNCGNLTEIACNDDYCGLISEVSFSVPPAAAVLIAVAVNNNSGGGPFALSVVHATASAQPFGMSCPNPGPTLTSTPPILGGVVTIDIQSATRLSPGALFYGGLAGFPFPLAGCEVYIDLLTIQSLVSYTTDQNGSFQLQAPLPNIPFLECAHIVMQAAEFGVPTANGFELTNGLDAQLGY